MYKLRIFYVQLLLVAIMPVALCADERRLWQNVPEDTTQLVQFSGKAWQRAEYQKLMQSAARQLGRRLKQEYGLDFKVHQFKYFLLACRCSESEAKKLRLYTTRFFRQFYPRYLRYEPQQLFQVVYFRNRAEMQARTRHNSYGYYAFADRTFYTYVGSGHGTLWHEMVHAFLHAEYKGSRPEWFEEGLASFYKMAFLDSRGRLLEGYANWRLPGLQARLRQGRVAPLHIALQRYHFGEDFHYAGARWFFAWLWTHNLLDDFVVRYLDTWQHQKPLAKQRQLIQDWLKGRLAMDWPAIEAEYKKSALQARKNQKLQQR